MFHVTKKQLSFLRRRWADVRLNHAEVLDDKIGPILDRFNDLIGVVTMYSCSSHPEKADNQWYVMLAVTKMGEEVIKRVFYNALERFSERDDHHGSKAHANLSFQYSTYGAGDREAMAVFGLYCPVMVMEHHLVGGSSKELSCSQESWTTALTEALDEELLKSFHRERWSKEHA